MQCAEGREVPLTLFCVLADQQRAAARDVPAGPDSDDGRQMMKLLSVQRQRAMHGGATLPPEFLSPPLFRSLRWRLSWWWWRMAKMDGMWHAAWQQKKVTRRLSICATFLSTCHGRCGRRECRYALSYQVRCYYRGPSTLDIQPHTT